MLQIRNPRLRDIRLFKVTWIIHWTSNCTKIVQKIKQWHLGGAGENNVYDKKINWKNKAKIKQ